MTKALHQAGDRGAAIHQCLDIRAARSGIARAAPARRGYTRRRRATRVAGSVVGFPPACRVSHRWHRVCRVNEWPLFSDEHMAAPGKSSGDAVLQRHGQQPLIRGFMGRHRTEGKTDLLVRWRLEKAPLASA